MDEHTAGRHPVTGRMPHDHTPPATRAIAPRWMPQWNRRLTNRVQGAWAPYLPPWAMIQHVGRRSGKAYETPVMALRHRGSYAVALPYGSHTDWVRNVFAAGGCRMRRGGRVVELTRPRVVTDPADGALPRALRPVAGRLGVLVLEVAVPPN